jgi:hypothetical protein
MRRSAAANKHPAILKVRVLPAHPIHIFKAPAGVGVAGTTASLSNAN